MAFFEKRSIDDTLIKASARFGRSKETTITRFSGRTYVHLSDMKHCFVDGKFDVTKSRSLTFSMLEIIELKLLLGQVEHYDELYESQQPNIQVTCFSDGARLTSTTSTATTSMQLPLMQPLQPLLQQQQQQQQQQQLRGQQLETASPVVTLSATPLVESQAFDAIVWDGDDELYFGVPVTHQQKKKKD